MKGWVSLLGLFSGCIRWEVSWDRLWRLSGEFYGLQYPFLLCALLALLDLVGRLIINPPKPKVQDPKAAKQVGMIDLLRNRRILITLGGVVIISSSYSSIELFGASWLIQEWGYSESRTSLCLLAFIVPNMIIAIFVGWLSDRVSRHRVIAIGLILHGLAAPLVPLSTNLASLIGFSILFGITAPIVNAPISPHLTAIVDSLTGASYARIYALYNMTWSVGMMAGPWVVGLVKSRFGFFVGMAVLAVTCIIYAPIFLLFSGVPKNGSYKNVTNNDSMTELEPNKG